MFVPATHTVRLIGVQPLAIKQLKQALHNHRQPAQGHDPSKPARLIFRVETALHPHELVADSPTDAPLTTVVLGLMAPTPDEMHADMVLRAVLVQKTIDFSVVYGSSTQQQLQQTWSILRQQGVIAPRLAQQNDQPSTANTKHHAPIWSCDACSDSACEYRLFSRFLQAPHSV